MASAARTRSCPTGKKCLSKGKADCIVQQARRSQLAHRQEQRIYFCCRCECWHTTKEEYKTHQQRQAERAQQ